MEIKDTLAAILVETNKPLLLAKIKFPDRLNLGQVLVRLITSGICGAQINEIDAVKGPDKFLPHLLGHEGFAEVIEVGPGVRKVKPGDRVVLHWRQGSGIQSDTPKYLLDNMVVNAGWVTTFNEFSIVSENRITPIPKDSDPYFAPLLGCALTTALGVLENDARINHRDLLLITGFGGVGVAVLQFAKYLGVKQVIVVDKDSNKQADALALGADFFVLADNKESATIQLREIYEELGRSTVAIETTGHSGLIELCYEETSEQARVVLVGVPKIGNNVSIYTLPLHFGKILTGSKGGNSNPDIDIPLINDLVNQGQIRRDGFPVTTFNFQEINSAIKKLREGTKGRIILDFAG